MDLFWLERFCWEESDGVASSVARRGDSDAGWALLRRSSGYNPGSFHKLSLAQAPPRWGDFSESANVCGHGTPQSRPATAPDRSEIGPYLGSLRATPQGPSANSASPRHLRGGAISPKAPGPLAWNTAEQARHSTGPLGDRSLPRKPSGDTPESFRKLSLTHALPRWGDFSESARSEVPDPRSTEPLSDPSPSRRAP